MTSVQVPATRVRGWIARALAAGYRDRESAEQFIAEALADEMQRGPWTGVVRVTALCVKDLIASRCRPAGLPMTAAPLRTTSPSHVPRSIAMDSFIQDIRYGVRQLVRQPVFALAAIVTMALGVGANTAIFNVAWHTMLKPLPYPHSEQLVAVWETSRRNGGHNNSMPGKFFDLQQQSRSLGLIAAYTARAGTTDLTGVGEPQQLDTRAVTADYFDVFGMTPLIGRTLNASDAVGDQSAVVISEMLWRDRFGARRDVLGSAIHLDGRTATVVGVMPSAFQIEGGRVDVWTPFTVDASAQRLAAHYLGVVARLAPGVTPQQAQSEITGIADRASAQFPTTDAAWRQDVVPLQQARRSDSVGDALFILGLAALAVLLIACANLASLQLARGVARQREFGIRAALGASRLRVVTQLLTEGFVISTLGTVVGILVGMWALQLLAAVAPPEIREAAREAPDPAVIGYAAGLAIVSTLVFSLAPSWRAASNAVLWLRQRTESADGKSRAIRLSLVAGQIGAAVCLLISAGLLVSSLSRVLNVDPGFKAEGALTFNASVAAQVDTFAKQRRLFDDMSSAISALPGVTAVCVINEIPLDATGGMTYVPEGQTRAVGAAPRTVTDGCIAALGLQLHRGRAVTANEPTRVALVSESFAKTAWPNQDPVGKRLHQGVADGALIEVVGVVNDALQDSLERRAYPQIYEAWTDGSAFWPSRFIVRSTVPPRSLFQSLTAAVRRVDPNQTVARLRTLNDVVGQSVAGRRFDLILLGSFSLVALVLAAIGVYGMLSQTVAQRLSEVSIRLALGATAGSVVRLMLNSAAVALVVGIPLGIGAALLGARLLGRFMFRMSATDPSIYAAVSVALIIVVLIAAWVPARRAARVNPAQTLR